ncbi:MAG: hypothetical protein JWN70_158 [Planctomycetaceae bacterium]|nr:hypothetical protein [Planctomycetaceae bacterium]
MDLPNRLNLHGGLIWPQKGSTDKLPLTSPQISTSVLQNSPTIPIDLVATRMFAEGARPNSLMSHLVEKHRSPARIRNHHTPVAKRRATRGWFAWCGAFLLLWSLCAAFARSEDGLPAGESGVLLLEGNRIVQGRITPQGQTYSVQQAAGTLIVSKDQVRFVGVDLQSVYVHLQDGLPKPASADDHVELARWCVGYRLLSEARFEFESALEIDPSRDDIRRNLTKLDSYLKRPVSTESKPVKSLTPAERMHKAAIGQDAESLGGLPREAGQVFTRRIQPIIMRNCTASACHGPKSDQTFKLSLVYQTGNQQQATTSKNLLALMPYIDRESPKSSKLWKLLKTNHGAIGNSIFVGQKGKEQLETFRNWLLSLEEEADEEPRTAKKHSPAKIQQAAHTAESKPRYQKGVRPPADSGIVQADAEDDAPPIPETRVAWPKKEGETAPRTRPAASPPTEKKTTFAKSGQLPETEPIISNEPPMVPDEVVEDPFDPNEFNSRQRVKKTLGS